MIAHETWRVTPRDEIWLTWLGRWRFASSAQIAQEFSRRGESAPLKVVERRMRACRELGLITSQRVAADLPRVHSLTRLGMDLVGVGGMVVGPNVAQFRHDYQVIDLAWELAREKPDHQLVTEREMRRADTPNAHRNAPPQFAVVLPVSGAVMRRIYPDLVTVTPKGGKWVHELEASRKDHRRLVNLMLAYTYAEHIRGARYYAMPHVIDGVQRAAKEANERADEVGRPVKVRVVAWTTGPTPPPASSGSPDGEHRG